MSVLTSLGIIVFVMLIQVFLQLKSGVFMLFRHYATAKYSRKKAHDLDGFFCMGIETAVTALLVVVLLAVSKLYILGIFESKTFEWIEAVILMFFGIAAFCGYFRWGDSTELFIPRKMSKSLRLLAKDAKNRSDAFALGVASIIGEFLWLLPVYFVFAIELFNFDNIIMPTLAMVIDILLSLLPILILRIRFRRGQNLAEIQRARVRKRNLYRLGLAGCYLVSGIIILILRVLI